MSRHQWSAEEYLQFEQERTLPAADLCARIGIERPRSILDVGCGPGNSSGILRRRYKDCPILGIDSSDEMVKSARRLHPDIEFRLLDAGRDLSAVREQYDIVFSNAALQWIPDNRRVVKSLASVVSPGGVLAVQVPYNGTAEIAKIIKNTVTDIRWSAKIEEARTIYTLRPDAYYDTLTRYFKKIDMWETEYYHPLETPDDIVSWYKGTGLRPYLNALSEPDKARFCRDITEQVRQKYKPRKDGKTIFRFNRLFFIASK